MNRSLILAVSLAATMSAAAFTLPMMFTGNSNPVGIPPYPPWLTSQSNEISASQLAAAYSSHNLTLELPSVLPPGYSLTSVHVPDPSQPFGLAVVTYSEKGITDLRYAEIVIQIAPGMAPSSNDLAAMVSSSHGNFTSSTVGGMPVMLNPAARNGDPALQKQFGDVPYAMFWKDGIYYQARVYSPLTVADLLRMIGSLEPGR